MTVSPAHRHMLEVESGISPEVIAARGYATVTESNGLYALGFNPTQSQLVPALYIPNYTPDGTNGRGRIRPDVPRFRKRKGRQERIKYEQPAGVALHLDCNPLILPLMADPSKPIGFVEGEKKADKLTTEGLATIALPGVYGYKGRNRFGGVTISADFDHIALKNRVVYILFDSDSATNPNVSRAEGTLATHLRRKGADVRIVRIPPAGDGTRQGADDFLVSGHTLEDLLALVDTSPAVLGKSFEKARADGLPAIQTNGRHLRDVSEDAYKALLGGPPYFYTRGGALVRIMPDEKRRPNIELATEPIMTGRLARVANFVSVREVEGAAEATPVVPPLQMVRDLLAAGGWGFPPLEAVIETPALRPDGSIITRPGHDPATGLYYYPATGLQVPDVPEKPTRQDVTAAVSLIREAIGDFPYADQHSDANAMAAYITPVVRPAIPGNVPLALADAPQAGTGKTLLASVITQTATGHDAPVITAPRDGDEWRKRITSTLMAGPAVILIDNLTGPLYAGELAAVLTTPVWVDRVLGHSQNVTLPNRAVWMATGNNVKLGGDLPRRCYWIRLDAQMSRPWQRTGFQHRDLTGWVAENRGRLIAAILTLARAWYAAGQPAPVSAVPTLGGFSEWARVVGGILAFAGVAGFLGNLEELYSTADEEGPQWEAFLNGLHARYGLEVVTVAEICARIATDAALVDLVPDHLDAPFDDKGAIRSSFKKRLGKALSSRESTRYGDSQVKAERLKADTHAKVARWRFSCGVCGICGVSVLQHPYQSQKNENSITDAYIEVGEANPLNTANPAPDEFDWATLEEAEGVWRANKWQPGDEVG